jgi:hypothetical protein
VKGVSSPSLVGQQAFDGAAQQGGEDLQFPFTDGKRVLDLAANGPFNTLMGTAAMARDGEVVAAVGCTGMVSPAIAGFVGGAPLVRTSDRLAAVHGCGLSFIFAEAHLATPAAHRNVDGLR